MSEFAGYHNLGRIGEGQFGTVDVVRSTADGQVFALKTVRKSKLARAGRAVDIDLERDIHSLARSTRSPYIPHLVACFQLPESLHLLITYSPCGTLWDLFVSTSSIDFLLANTLNEHPNSLEERVVKYYASQVALGIAWLHETAGVVHRDIKPQNCLIDLGGRIKICDFGSAARLVDVGRGAGARADIARAEDSRRDRKRSRSPTIQSGTSGLWPRPRYVSLSDCSIMHGTPDYIAPEIITFYENAVLQESAGPSKSSGNVARERTEEQAMGYDASVDWWSFGVMLYELVIGKPAFWAQDIRRTHGRVLDCENSLSLPSHPPTSPALQDFIKSLLVFPQHRLGQLGPAQIQSHPWFSTTSWLALARSPPPAVPSWLNPPGPIDLNGLEDSIDAGIGSCDWSDEDETTFADIEQSERDQSLAKQGWADWPWIDAAPSKETGASLSTTSSTSNGSSFSPYAHLATPAPQKRSHHAATTDPPRTVLRSVMQQKVEVKSSKKAMRQLKQCVLASARKKVEISGKEAGGDVRRGFGRAGAMIRQDQVAKGRTFMDRLNDLATNGSMAARDTNGTAEYSDHRIGQSARSECSRKSPSLEHHKHNQADVSRDQPASMKGGMSLLRGKTKPDPSRHISTPDLDYMSDSGTSTQVITADEEYQAATRRPECRTIAQHTSVRERSQPISGEGSLHQVGKGVQQLQRNIDVIDRALASVRARLEPASPPAVPNVRR